VVGVKTGKKRWLVAVVGTVGVILAAGLYRFATDHEPRYEGKPVSHWFREVCRRAEADDPGPARVAEAEEAFRKMGTNALPYLVKQALDTRPDSAMRIFVYKWLEKLPEAWRPRRFVSRDEMCGCAEEMIEYLSFSTPSAAILPLVQKALDSSDPLQRRQALELLSRVRIGGEIFVPYFAKALHDPDPKTQSMAMEFLNMFSPKAEDAVPDLVALLQKPEAAADLRLAAAGVLGRIGSNATVALPLLRRSFAEETNEWRRLDYAVALCRIDAGQNEAFNYFTNLLIRQQRPLWSEFSLTQVGPNAKAAIPALVEIMNGTNTEAWQWIVGCLWEIGAPKELYLPKLREKFHSNDASSRLLAARDLLASDPADQECQAYFIGLLKNPASNDDARRSAIIFLGRAGDRARSAIPAIMTVFDRTNQYNWGDVTDALKSLGASRELLMPKLKQKLKSPDAETKRWFAAKILDMAPADREAQLALIDLISRKTAAARQAIDDLANRANPPAQEVLPALLEAQKSGSRSIREAARWASKKLKAKESPK
jgi:hypothetical protein